MERHDNGRSNDLWQSERRASRRSVLRVAVGAGLGWAGASLLAACSGGTAPPAAKPAAAPASAAAPAPAGGQAAPQTVKMRMACWSNPLSEQTNVYAAQEFGWFTDQGIDFEFIPGAGGGDALKNLLAGNADIAFANTEAM